MNKVAAIVSCNEGTIAYADFDFSSIGYVAQVLNRPYFVAVTNAFLSVNTLAFSQTIGSFSVKGLRYVFRPFYNAVLGDTGGSVSAGHPESPNLVSAFVYNNSNFNTEAIGFTREEIETYWLAGAGEQRIQGVHIIGANDFECELADNIDVTALVACANTPSPYGRLQLQFTSFKVKPFCKTVTTLYKNL